MTWGKTLIELAEEQEDIKRKVNFIDLGNMSKREAEQQIKKLLPKPKEPPKTIIKEDIGWLSVIVVIVVFLVISTALLFFNISLI